MAVVSMFTFSAAWDEFPLAITMLSSPSHFTLPIGLADFIGSHTTAWGPFFAGSVIATVPVVVVVPHLPALGAQRDFPRRPALSPRERLMPLNDLRAFYRTGEEIVLRHAAGRQPPRVVARCARGDVVEAECGDGARFRGAPARDLSVEAHGPDGAVLAEELTTVGAHAGERPVHGFATSFQTESVPAVLGLAPGPALHRRPDLRLDGELLRPARPAARAGGTRPAGPCRSRRSASLAAGIRDRGAVAHAYAPVYAVDAPFRRSPPRAAHVSAMTGRRSASSTDPARRPGQRGLAAPLCRCLRFCRRQHRLRRLPRRYLRLPARRPRPYRAGAMDMRAAYEAFLASFGPPGLRT